LRHEYRDKEQSMDRSAALAPGVIYNAADVSRILGLPADDPGDQVITVPDGEIVIYYGGWDMKTLRTSVAAINAMRQVPWYDNATAESGYYRLLLPMQGSNCKNWEEQAEHLQATGECWHPAPVVVAATALLVHLVNTNDDFLHHGYCRCAESIPDDRRAGISVRCGGVVCVDGYWGDIRDDRLWLAAAQKS
jgi:hypothetical protein